MEKFENPGGVRVEATPETLGLNVDIRSSLDRVFNWQIRNDPEPKFSFDQIVEMLVQNPLLIHPAKIYLSEVSWAKDDLEASEHALQKLAWALVKNFAKVDI